MVGGLPGSLDLGLYLDLVFIASLHVKGGTGRNVLRRASVQLQDPEDNGPDFSQTFK